MKFWKVLVFTLLFVASISIVFSQVVMGPAAEWKRPGMFISPRGVITAGSTVEVSATIKILKNVRGLKYKGGVDTTVIKEQTFPGLLLAGKTIPVKFRWKATKGRHNIFLRLIIPGKTRRPVVKKLNKTINVVLSAQSPGDNSNISSTVIGPANRCQENSNLPINVEIVKFTGQYNPSNKTIIYEFDIKNRGARCLKTIDMELYFSLPGAGDVRVVSRRPLDPIGSGDWTLLGNQKRTFMDHYQMKEYDLKLHPSGKCFPCSNNLNNRCARLMVMIWPDGGGYKKAYLTLTLGPIAEE